MRTRLGAVSMIHGTFKANSAFILAQMPLRTFGARREERVISDAKR
jgi:hypothetical protein